MIKRAIPRIRDLLHRARTAGCMVIHVRGEYGPAVRHVGVPYALRGCLAGDINSSLGASNEQAEWTPRAHELAQMCQPGSWGAEFVDGISPQCDEQVVTKHRFSGFTDTHLELLLRSNGMRTVVLAGFTTDGCVESSVRDAAARDLYAILVEDCTAVRDEERHLHEASCEMVSKSFGIVAPAEDIIFGWRGVGNFEATYAEARPGDPAG